MAMSRWMSLRWLSVAGSILTATLFAPAAFSKEPRFPQLTMDQLNEQQKLFADRAVNVQQQQQQVRSAGAGDPNPIGGTFNVLLRSPVLGGLVMDLTIGYLNDKTSVPLKLNEFAILIVAAQWRAPYVWYVHAPKSTKIGLSPDIIEALRNNKRPSNMVQDEELVYDFVTELTTKKTVSDATFARAKKIFNDQQIVDLTVCAGNYTMVSMLLAMKEDTIPAGWQDPFK